MVGGRFIVVSARQTMRKSESRNVAMAETFDVKMESHVRQIRIVVAQYLWKSVLNNISGSGFNWAHPQIP
jgi:hypothetical protein